MRKSDQIWAKIKSNKGLSEPLA